MPREKENYRVNLDRILDRFGGKEILSLSEVIEYTGMDRRTLLKSGLNFRQTVEKKSRYKGGNYFVTAANLASWLS